MAPRCSSIGRGSFFLSHGKSFPPPLPSVSPGSVIYPVDEIVGWGGDNSVMDVWVEVQIWCGVVWWMDAAAKNGQRSFYP